MTFSLIFGNAGNIEMGRESFSFIGLSILGTWQTLATFQLPGNISLPIDELITFTIGEVISSATGFGYKFTYLGKCSVFYDKCAIRSLFRNNGC